MRVRAVLVACLVATHARRWPTRRLATLLLAVLLCVAPYSVRLAAAHETTRTIASAGPLSSITVSPDLSCDVRHVGDNLPAFYGGDACGTFVAYNDVLYGPADIPAGSAANPRTRFTPVSQSGVEGAGTTDAPWTIQTTVALGESGVKVIQTDSYVSGADHYRTKVEINNPSSSEITAVAYRAGDCYLANSDLGYGAMNDSLSSSQWTACLDQEKKRILQWRDVDSADFPVNVYQAGYSSVWAAIATQQPFPDTCQCDVYQDNGAGISASIKVPSGQDRSWVSQVAFTPTAASDDHDGDGLKDSWEEHGVDIGGKHLPLDEMGADPDIKDIFLQINWMSTHYTNSCNWLRFWNCETEHRFAPTRTQLDKLVDVFKKQGINLHVDAGSVYPMKPDGTRWPNPGGGMTVQYRENFSPSGSRDDIEAAFAAANETSLRPERQDVFHLAVIGDSLAPNEPTSGYSRTTGGSYFVALRQLTSDAEKVGTLLHELGHNLYLGHGGSWKFADGDVYCKTAYKSSMNYLYQFKMQDYGAETSTGNPGISPEQVQTCKDLGGQDGMMATEPYDVHSDWDNLVFDFGPIGGLSAGSLLPPHENSEPTHEELADADLTGVDGDGGLRLPILTPLIEGVANQTIRVQVTNTGSISATYRTILSLPDGTKLTEEVAVPAHGQAYATFDLAGYAVTEPSLAVDVSLKSLTLDRTVSELNESIPVLPSDQEGARSALQELTSGTVPGLDSDDAQRYKAMLDGIANPWSMTGFYAPLKRSGSTIVKRGAIVPVKFAVLRGVQPITDPAELDLKITVQPVDCSTGAARGSSSPAAAAAGTKLRYDSDSEQFVFSWDTRPIAAGCHALVARAKTGASLKAVVTLR